MRENASRLAFRLERFFLFENLRINTYCLNIFKSLKLFLKEGCFFN